MLELFLIVASVYFIYKSWSVYTTAYNKVKDSFKTKEPDLSPEDVEVLKRLLAKHK